MIVKRSAKSQVMSRVSALVGLNGCHAMYAAQGALTLENGVLAGIQRNTIKTESFVNSIS